MEAEISEDPLSGFEWNQAELIPSFNIGMLSLVAFGNNRSPHGIGTGFVIKRDDRSAICLTAAHVFSEIRNIQTPHRRYVPSALPEFLPPPRRIDLSRENVRAIALEGNRAEALVVNFAIIDEARDVAAFQVALQSEDSPAFFSGEYQVDDEVPSVGERICILSYGNLATFGSETDGALRQSFSMARTPVMRVGKVIAIHPDGHRLCRGPCIETTVPVYSGMSGGLFSCMDIIQNPCSLSAWCAQILMKMGHSKRIGVVQVVQ